MIEQTPLEKILFGKPKYVEMLLDACGIDRNDEWTKSLNVKYHDFMDADGPMEVISKTDLTKIMEHCRNSDMKVKLREFLGAF